MLVAVRNPGLQLSNCFDRAGRILHLQMDKDYFISCLESRFKGKPLDFLYFFQLPECLRQFVLTRQYQTLLRQLDGSLHRHLLLGVKSGRYNSNKQTGKNS